MTIIVKLYCWAHNIGRQNIYGDSTKEGKEIELYWNKKLISDSNSNLQEEIKNTKNANM